MSKTCVSHHHACDCREKKFRELEAESQKLREALKKGRAMSENGRIEYKYEDLYQMHTDRVEELAKTHGEVAQLKERLKVLDVKLAAAVDFSERQTEENQKLRARVDELEQRLSLKEWKRTHEENQTLRARNKTLSEENVRIINENTEIIKSLGILRTFLKDEVLPVVTISRGLLSDQFFVERILEKHEALKKKIKELLKGEN